MEHVVILLLALIIDLLVGEYPRRLHPVVWLGSLISLELRLAPRRGKRAQLSYGAGMVLLTTGLLGAGTYFLLDYLRDVSMFAYIVVAVLLLKSTFSVKELNDVALRVKDFLEGGNLSEARNQVATLVSRDTSQLDSPHLVSATVESTAENVSDSFVAPLLYFLLLGVPGAVAYRVANTFDAMVGYHGEYEFLGKVAARLDDILNFVPSRISALLIVGAAHLLRRDGRAAWRMMLRDHVKTESPNSGWPMSATAGALGTRLEKIGHYRLGNANNPLTASTITWAMRLVNATAGVWLGICIAAMVAWFELTA